MNRNVILRPEAEAEVAEAIDWYESRGKGLGADFMRAVDAAMAAIKRNPEQYQIVKGQVRRLCCVASPTALSMLLHNTKSLYLPVFTVGAIPEDGSSGVSRVGRHNRQCPLLMSASRTPHDLS
jgi:hypothetical protein